MTAKVLPWKKKYTYKPHVPNKPGLYAFYDTNGRLLYTGHASRLRHRIQSYRQDDCFSTHPTKRSLRPKIAKFKYEVMPEMKARVVEKKLKKKAKFNFN